MNQFREYLRNSDNAFIKIIYILLKKIWNLLVDNLGALLCYVCRMFPLQDKIVVSAFNGRKYGDNPQFILEKLAKIKPNLDIVWIQDYKYSYSVPESMRTIAFAHHDIKKIYEFATAKVWISTDMLELGLRKRKGQLFIETWHGGLGIKKVGDDAPEFFGRNKNHILLTNNLADLFISNSNHLTAVYRHAFNYTGKIWKCGYPKNDVLFCDPDSVRRKIREFYGLDDCVNILVYAPTFRDSFWKTVDMGVYNIDYARLRSVLEEKMGGDWYIFVRFHHFIIRSEGVEEPCGEHIINATEYPDMQELILACDAFISDYSSCIFDAAIREIPCFTYAVDFEAYKKGRGVYYEMEELPFPYARSNDELVENIRQFNFREYLSAWDAFKLQTGLHETGHAAQDIAELVDAYIKGDTGIVDRIEGEP